MSTDTKVWREHAQVFRRMAKTSAEAERKLLALAARAQEQAGTVEQEAERSQD